jgi:putative transcriptional regulator
MRRPLLFALALLLLPVAALTRIADPSAPVPRGADRGRAGMLLVASPAMPSNFFARTVILLLKDDASGAFGLVVNRRLGSEPMAALAQVLGSERAARLNASGLGLRLGGPVEPDHPSVLYFTDEGAYAVGDLDRLLPAIASGRGPVRAVVVFGYAGWGPGKLSNEFARGDWQLAEADVDLVFAASDEGKWERALASHR